MKITFSADMPTDYYPSLYFLSKQKSGFFYYKPPGITLYQDLIEPKNLC